MNSRVVNFALLCLMCCFFQESSAAPPDPRDPHTPGFVEAKELPDGDVPPTDENGNFIIGPTHKHSENTALRQDVPHGHIHDLTMYSKDSKIYPGIAREPNTFGSVDPAHPDKMIVTTSHPAPYTRQRRGLCPSAIRSRNHCPVHCRGRWAGQIVVRDAR